MAKEPSIGHRVRKGAKRGCLRQRSLATKSFAAGMIALCCGSVPALAAESVRRISDYTLRLDPVFAFNGARTSTLPSHDCKFVPEARSYFQNEEGKGHSFTYLDHTSAGSFLSYAYYGTLSAPKSIDVDLVAVEDVPGEGYRVYIGSSKVVRAGITYQSIYCGFADAQKLNAEWAIAGLQHKSLFAAVPEPNQFDKLMEELSGAYYDLDYDSVENSLSRRGFGAVELPDSVTERCSPGTEIVCESYKNAVCRQNAYGKYCNFVWKDPGARNVIVSTKVGFVSQYVAELTVSGVEKLDSTNE